MKIVIRTDASVEIGTGHVMRCLTLAHQFKKKGVDVFFICREFKGNLISLIQKQEFPVFVLPAKKGHNHWQWIKENWEIDALETKELIKQIDSKIDLMIVDHYELDEKWEKMIRSSAEKIMVIDDLANRPHDCDLLLDQNYYLNSKTRYNKLLPNSCIQLLGPNYLLLREEFLFIDPLKIKRDGTVNNILIFFSGTDPTGETVKAIKAIKQLNRPDIKVNVVVGASNPLKDLVEELCAQMPNVQYHCQINYMAELMIQADLAIGAGGSTAWERCFLGLPSISLILADNQKELSEAVSAQGAMCCLGQSEEVEPCHITNKIKELLEHPKAVITMVQKCHELIDPVVVKKQLAVKNLMELSVI